jgi:hypothetical protein
LEENPSIFPQRHHSFCFQAVQVVTSQMKSALPKNKKREQARFVIIFPDHFSLPSDSGSLLGDGTHKESMLGLHGQCQHRLHF